MTVSKNFTHLFQLKAKGGDENQPIVTITGVKRNGADVIEVRHSATTGSIDTIYPGTNWAGIRNQWLVVFCRATFSDRGSLYLTVKKLDGTVLFEVNQTGIDMWRSCEFVRPKWGIYRSLKDKTNLRPDEETVRFANFSISKALIQ
jgi:hypothetical protein